MAIPVYRQQLGTPVGAPGVNVAGAGEGLARGLLGIAAGIERVQQVGDHLAQSEAEQESGDLYLKALTDFDAFERSLDGDADYKTYEKRFDEFQRNWQAQNLSKAGQRTQQVFQQRYGDNFAKARIGVRDMARRTQVDVTLAGLAQKEDAAFELIGRSPEGALGMAAYQAVAQSYADAFKAGLITRQGAEAKRQDLEQRLGVTQVAAAIEANPYEAKKALAGGQWDSVLQPEKKAQLVSAAESEIKRREAEAKAAAAEARANAAIDNIVWKAGFEDEIAYLQDGNVGGSGNYTPEEITRRMVQQYGPEKGAMLAEEMIASVKRAEDFGLKYAEVSTASDEELRAMLEAEKADMGSSKDYQTERAEAVSLAQAIDKRNQEIAADSGAYAIKHSTTVREAYEAMAAVQSDPNADPAAVQAAANNYASVASAELERLTGETGLPYLPGAYVTSVAKQFASQEKGGEGPAATVEGLQQVWGDRWPEVYGQLVTEKALPPGAVVLGSGVPGAASARLAEVLDVPMEDLKKGLAETDVTAAKDAVAEEMQDFLRVTSQYAGAETTVSAFYDAAERQALSYMRGGMDATTAAEKAVKELLTDRYTFDERFFVPIEEEPVIDGEPDTGAIAGRAHDLLSRLDSFPVDPAFSGLVPRITVPAYDAPGITEDEKRQQYLSAIASGGYWVTSPDQKGLVLHDSTGSAVLVGDQPLFLPWSAFKGEMTPADAARRLWE